MPSEIITLRDAAGAESPGSAEVLRRSTTHRAVRAAALILGALLCATVCIVIPIVHLFTTWAIPLIGVLLAVRVIRREVEITRVEGKCPACGAMIDERDRGRDDPSIQVCPHCDRRLQIVTQASADSVPQGVSIAQAAAP